MPRHPSNTNLHLHHANTFQGLPVMAEKGPFIEQYLSRLHCTIERSLRQYSRVFAFRVDLRLPLGVELPDYVYTNEVISRFLESFKAKIELDRQRARTRHRYAHDSRVRYVWAREESGGERPHYHLLILLNGDAYYSLGRMRSDASNMIKRLHEAWGSALGLFVDLLDGLVEIPDNAVYRISRDIRTGQEDKLPDLFRRASYLCKAATKNYGDGQHGFGCSRG